MVGRKSRVLFVDDETLILRGIRRMLMEESDEWDLLFAESGKEALAIMEREQVDVIVSDMKMPEMDGAELLSRVMEKHPEIIRIILSGYSEQTLIMKTVKAAHQFLTKPISRDELVATIRKTIALRTVVENGKLRTLVSGFSEMSSVIDSGLELMEELKKPEPSIARIAGIIEKNVSVTGNIMKLVNSAFFGMPRKVSSMEQAVSLLGITTVKALFLYYMLTGVNFTTIRKDFSIDKFNIHSYRVGLAAKKIALELTGDQEFGAEAYMAGLLHDIGTLILLKDKKSKNSETGFPQSELNLWGGTHADVGAYLLGLWGFDKSLINAVHYHHNPTECPEKSASTLLKALHPAEVIVTEHELGRGTGWLDLNFVAGAGLNDKLPFWMESLKEVFDE